MLVKIGCCGFPYSMKKYFQEFSLVEVQRTFYNIPNLATVRSWREMAPETFEFTIKAWQVITHPPSSPTWKKAKIAISKEHLEKYGYLRPTRENMEAWNKTFEVANALNAKVIILQTPPSFKPTAENVRAANEFFSKIKRDHLNIAWEPRGEWNRYKGLRELLERHNIIHVVDILKREPILIEKSNIVYTRLHGLNGEINYRYKYNVNDFKNIINRILKLPENIKSIYVLFNNVYMSADAKLFKRYCKEYGLECV